MNLKDWIFVCLFLNALKTQPYLATDQVRHLVRKSEEYDKLYQQYLEENN